MDVLYTHTIRHISRKSSCFFSPLFMIFERSGNIQLVVQRGTGRCIEHYEYLFGHMDSERPNAIGLERARRHKCNGRRNDIRQNAWEENLENRMGFKMPRSTRPRVARELLIHETPRNRPKMGKSTFSWRLGRLSSSVFPGIFWPCFSFPCEASVQPQVSSPPCQTG